MTESADSYLQQSLLIKVFEGVGTLGAIFVSRTADAHDLDLLKEKGIQAVICAQKDEKINLPKKQVPQYLYFEIEDHVEFNITQFFEQSFKFFEENRRMTNILVHCKEGTNCSVALVISYLIKKYQYTFQQALQLIKRRYPNFSTTQFNLGFVHRLEYFAVQKGNFNLIKENVMRKRIERVRRTFDGIVRSYSKELTTQEKLMGSPSPKKVKNRNYLGSMGSMISFKSQSFLPYTSAQMIVKSNPEEETEPSRQMSKEYSKFLPQKTEQQIEDDEHHKKIVSEIFMLNEQSKLYRSKRIQSINSDVSPLNNYDRLKKCMKKHAFYSPLKRYDKYEMFTQNKLNIKFQAFTSVKR